MVMYTREYIIQLLLMLLFLVCHNYGRRKSRKEEEGEETIYYYTSLFEYIESDEETRFPISKRSCFSYSVLLLK